MRRGLNAILDAAWTLVWIAAALGAVLLIAFVVNSFWPSNWTFWHDRDYNKVVTIKDFIRTRDFEPNQAHKARVQKLPSGDYRVTIFKGKEAVVLTLPSEKVNVVPAAVTQTVATLVYNYNPLFSEYAHTEINTRTRVDNPYAPHSGGDAANAEMAQLTQLSLGELLEIDLHVVAVKAPLAVYKVIK